MNSHAGHDRLSRFAFDLIGSAIVLAIVWGGFTTLFAVPTIHEQLKEAPPVVSAYGDLYDSVMTHDDGWLMLARQ